jgi:hypothetical protein
MGGRLRLDHLRTSRLSAQLPTPRGPDRHGEHGCADRSATLPGPIRHLLTAIVQALLPDGPPLAPGDRKEVERDTVSFVVRQVEGLPRHLFLPFVVLLGVFSVLAAVRFQRPFPRLDLPRRRRWLEAWSSSPFSVARDFIKLLRGLAYLSYHDHVLLQAALAVWGKDGIHA